MKENAKRVLTVSLSLVLALVLAVCGFVALFNQPVYKESTAVDENGNVLQSGVVHKLARAVTFSTTENTGIKFEATVTSDGDLEPTNPRVDWALAWNFEATGGCGWLNQASSPRDISEYVTITPESDGSRIATLRCLQPFGTQILLTVSSREDPTKNATATIDYAQRIDKMQFISPSGPSIVEGNSIVLSQFDIGIGGMVNTPYGAFSAVGSGIYSLAGNFANQSVNIKYSQEFIDAFVASEYGSAYASYINYDVVGQFNTQGSPGVLNNPHIFAQVLNIDRSDENYASVVYAMIRFLASHANDNGMTNTMEFATYLVTVTDKYSYRQAEFPISIKESCIHAYVKSVTLSQTEVVL